MFLEGSEMEKSRRDFIKETGIVGSMSLLGAGCGSVKSSEKEVTITNQNFKDTLQKCLGGPWPEPCSLNAKVIKTIQKDGYRLEFVEYDLEPGDRVTSILLVPDGVKSSKSAPAVAVWHQHNGEWHLGKSEPAGLTGNPEHHTGVALAKLGYVVLCPDALCFEERQDPEKKFKGSHFERFEFLRYVVDGKSMAWKNILDMKRAVDYLASRPEVDSERMGCYGHSMGSTHTWLVGPWDPRLKVLVANCCLPTYGGIHRTRILHCFPNFIPGIHQYGDTPDIAALIAPRRLHINLGEKDSGTPIKEAEEGIKKIAQAYSAAGVSEKFTHFIEPGAGHVLSEKMWAKAKAAFAEL